MSAVKAGVIGASSESIYAIEEAKKRGIRVIAIDGAESAPGLQYADEGYVVDIRDIDAVFDFFDAHPVDFLLPVPVGRILTTSGAVNERYDLPGVGRIGTDLSTDKWKFHEVLSAAGLRNAEAVLIDDKEKIELAKSMKYPIIFKPRYGSGSRDVKAYNSYNELCSEAKSLPLDKEEFIAETCKDGTEYGADAIVINGEYKLILLREKLLTPPPYRQCVGYYSVEKNEERKALFSDVEELLEKTVKIFGTDNCLLHADIMYDGSEAFLIELSPRPSGHYLHNCFTRYACGFDMLGEYLDFVCSKNSMDEYKVIYEYAAKSMLIKYFDIKEGVIKALPNEDEIKKTEGVICYNNLMKVGERIEKVTDGKSIMGRGFYIVEAPTLAKCEDICREVESRIIIAED